MTKPTWLDILGGIAVVGGAVTTGILTAGVGPGLVAGFSALGAWIAGRQRPTPAAVKAFGDAAK
jgi:hypothetical protein